MYKIILEDGSEQNIQLDDIQKKWIDSELKEGRTVPLYSTTYANSL